METLIVKGKYKVIRVLRTEDHFAACVAVDITDPGNGKVLLDIYDGELLKPYIGYFSGLRHCAEFQDLFLFEESAVAVFSYAEGKTVDDAFFMGHRVPLPDCIEAADRLVEKTIAISDWPANVSCPLLLTEQLLYEKHQNDFRFSYVIVPLPKMNERELCLLLSDQLKKILMIRIDTPLKVREFVRSLDDTPYESVLKLSSVWHTVREEIRGEAALSAKGNILSRLSDIIRINIRDYMDRRKKLKRKGEAV